MEPQSKKLSQNTQNFTHTDLVVTCNCVHRLSNFWNSSIKRQCRVRYTGETLYFTEHFLFYIPSEETGEFGLWASTKMVAAKKLHLTSVCNLRQRGWSTKPTKQQTITTSGLCWDICFTFLRSYK